MDSVWSPWGAPDCIVDGAIIVGGVVSDVIRQLFDRNGIKTKKVVASLSGNAVIVKRIVLPLMSDEELRESIYWEAEHYIPFDIQDVNLDYQVLQADSGAESTGTMDVLLVVAKKEKIADYTGVISQAWRIPVVVDIDAFALQNVFEANYGVDRVRFSPPSSAEFQNVLFETNCLTSLVDCVNDHNGQVVSYPWDFGDGTSGTGASVTHDYSSPASYSVSLAVKDAFALSASTVKSVTVVSGGRVVNFDVSASTGLGLIYTWNFGDGDPETVINANITHAFHDNDGPRDVVLTVTDIDENSASITNTVDPEL